jgi:uncharacterized protein (DUF1330 family)
MGEHMAAEIQQQGKLDNTLIFYIWGDNGSSAEGQNGTISELLALNGIPSTITQHIKTMNDLAGLDVLGSPKADNMYHAEADGPGKRSGVSAVELREWSTGGDGLGCRAETRGWSVAPRRDNRGRRIGGRPLSHSKAAENARENLPLAPFGGHYVIRTVKTTSLDGTAPQRFVVLAFDSVEKAQALHNSPGTKEVDAIPAKSTKSHSFIVERM